MMALNRYRLKHLVKQGHRGAKLAHALLAHTDRLLGVILLGNNLVNAAAATLVGMITIQLLRREQDRARPGHPGGHLPDSGVLPKSRPR